MNSKRISKRILVAVVALAISIVRQEGASAKEDDKNQAIPLFDDGVIVRIPVKVFNDTLYFVVDTGSSISMLDDKYRDRLGTSIGTGVAATPVSQGDHVPIYRAPDFFVGATHGDLKQVLSVNLAMLKYVSGEPCDGILGMDFFQNHVVRVDFDSRSLAIVDHLSEDFKRKATAVPLHPLFKNQVGLEAVIDSTTTVSLKIDTGDNGSISLNPHDWEQVLAGRKDVKIHTTLTGTLNRDATQISIARLPDVEIGPQKYQNLLCSLSPAHEARSTIGTGFLRRHSATFDFPNHMLYLTPGKAFNDLDNLDMTGLHLVRRDGRTLVYSVDEHSPAAEAGMEPGDIINLIDGKDAAQMKMKAIRQRLKSNDGDRVAVDIVRGETNKSLVIVLKKAL